MVTVTVWAIASLHANPTPCQKNFFYDEGTDRCEQCYDICHMAKFQKTEEQCARQCPDYKVPDKEATVKPAAGYSPLSSPATAAIASVIVGVALCFIVFVTFKRQRIVELLRLARCSPAGTSPEDREASQRLRVGVQEVGDGGADSLLVDDNSNSRVQQESDHGRFGAQELALVGSSAESGLSDENVEPKTLHI